MKSHDYHIFMGRLLPIALRELLPTNIWKALTELSQFLRDLSFTQTHIDGMVHLEKNIPEILCKLEKFFPPFFNVMEHLPIHLPYQVRVGGPVQYTWMYSSERQVKCNDVIAFDIICMLIFNYANDNLGSFIT